MDSFFMSYFFNSIQEIILSLESETKDAIFVCLSDVWLDSTEVFSHLKTMLQGFLKSGIHPTAFIFMGDFCSEPYVHSSNRMISYQGELFLL